MPACIADDLGGGVEAHRLAVEEGRGEDLGVMAFEPGRDIDEEREAGGVALREAVGAEALDLMEAPFGKVLRVAATRHPADLIQPRGETPPYAPRRSIALERYRKGESPSGVYVGYDVGKISDVGK